MGDVWYFKPTFSWECNIGIVFGREYDKSLKRYKYKLLINIMDYEMKEIDRKGVILVDEARLTVRVM